MPADLDAWIADLRFVHTYQGAHPDPCPTCNHNARVDSARAHVAALLADKDAKIARMGEALRDYHRFRVELGGGSFLMACSECGTATETHRASCGTGALLAPDAVSRAIEEHRAMVAELDARRTLDEEHARDCAINADADPPVRGFTRCTCGLAERKEAARKVLDGYRAAPGWPTTPCRCINCGNVEIPSPPSGRGTDAPTCSKCGGILIRQPAAKADAVTDDRPFHDHGPFVGPCSPEKHRVLQFGLPPKKDKEPETPAESFRRALDFTRIGDGGRIQCACCHADLTIEAHQ